MHLVILTNGCFGYISGYEFAYIWRKLQQHEKEVIILLWVNCTL